VGLSRLLGNDDVVLADDDELGWPERSEADGAVVGEEAEAHWSESLLSS
jgi:hypothetical protein